MLGSAALEVLLGLALVYIVFSTVCSLFTEWWANRKSWRAMVLKESLEMALDGKDSSLAAAFFSHPAIQRLSFARTATKKAPALPSYIASNTFALAMIDLVIKIEPPTGNSGGETKILKEARNTEKTPISTDTQRLLHTITQGTNGSIGHVQDRLEKWYDELMLRTSGFYKRKAKFSLWIFAVLIVVVFNVDTVSLVKALRADASMRAGLASYAERLANDSGTSSDQMDKVEQIRKEITELRLPIGWQPGVLSRDTIVSKAAGWFLSAIAISFGAPFWFDMLNKLVNIRQVGGKPPSVLSLK